MAEETQNSVVASTGLTARVADSYGDNPHEHKPSQDPFDADEILKQEEDECPGTSSSTSPTVSEDTETKPKTSPGKPARNVASRGTPARTDNSSALSTEHGTTA